MKEESNDIELIITKVLNQEATVEEQSQLEYWLAESEANKKLFESYKKIIDKGQEYFNSQQHIKIDVDAEWAAFQDKLAAKKVIQMEPKATASSRWLQIAAAVVVLMVSGYVLYNFISKDTVYLQTADVPEEFTLPDESVITLNANSVLSYNQDFGKNKRTVELKGEAFFEITSDKTRPFIITAGEAEVEVLGTSFNVSVNNGSTEVIVATGVVELSSKETKESIELTPGERGLLEKDSKIIETKNSDPNFNAWKTRTIIFEEADLVAVVNALNKVYHANISISTNVSQSCIVTVTFEQQSLDAVLNVLESTLDLTLKRNGRQVEITEAGC